MLQRRQGGFPGPPSKLRAYLSLTISVPWVFFSVAGSVLGTRACSLDAEQKHRQKRRQPQPQDQTSQTKGAVQGNKAGPLNLHPWTCTKFLQWRVSGVSTNRLGSLCWRVMGHSSLLKMSKGCLRFFLSLHGILQFQHYVSLNKDWMPNAHRELH